MASKKLRASLAGVTLLIFAGLAASGRLAGRQREASNKDDRAARRAERVERGIAPLQLGQDPPIELDLERLMKLNNDPGLSVAVIDGYRIAWAKAYGTTEAGGKDPVSTRTLFQAGSISKPVAATGMLALVEAGRLSLDEDVNLKLKSWKVPGNEFTRDEKVTLRRLASHTAGLTVHGFPGYDVDERVPTLVQILDGEKPANTPAIRVDLVPGTRVRYSGGGVTIEQLLMSDVAGKPFPELMRETVLAKIAMADSSYAQPLEPQWAARTACGTYAGGKPVHGRWHVYPEMAAAGLWTTPTDLAKFAIEIALSRQGKANQVLSQKTAVAMLTPVLEEAGLGFFISKERPGEFGHNGADEGFQALLVMNWETGQGLAIMANSDNGIAVAQEVLRSVAREYAWKYPPGPRSDGEQLALLAQWKGADAVLAKFDQLKNAKKPEEGVLNAIGYRVFLSAGKTAEAVRVFEKNAAEYPGSANVWDSLAEAYAAAGRKQLAIENYEKSLELDPANDHAKQELKKLRE